MSDWSNKIIIQIEYEADLLRQKEKNKKNNSTKCGMEKKKEDIATQL